MGTLVNVVLTIRKDERQQSVKPASTEHQHRINIASTEHQHSINDVRCCILYNPLAVLMRLPLITVLAGFRRNVVSVNITAAENERQQSFNRASTERQQSWVLHLV
jgi:hypothetical protein